MITALSNGKPRRLPCPHCERGRLVVIADLDTGDELMCLNCGYVRPPADMPERLAMAEAEQGTARNRSRHQRKPRAGGMTI